MNARLKLNDSLKLIRSFKTSGTVTPSSRVLIGDLLKAIDFSQDLTVVELGPGNGCVTRALLQRLSPGSRLLSFEINEGFFADLASIDDDRLTVVHACASALDEKLREMEITEADHIVSSLPLGIIDTPMVREILLRVNKSLKPGGRFLQYQYTLKNLSDVKPHFSNVRLRFTLRNMPPAFVYECTK